MYVHLGGGCLIRAAEIIGIFSVKDNKEFYKGLKNKDGKFYEAEDLSEGGRKRYICRQFQLQHCKNGSIKT